MNWLKVISAILQAGPEVLKLIEAIAKAFQSLPKEHQDAIREVAAKLPG